MASIPLANPLFIQDFLQGEIMNHYPRRALIMLACLLAVSCGTDLLAQKGGTLKVVNVEGRMAGSMSSAGVLAGETLYVAGQNGRSNDGSLAKDFSQEVSQSLRNVQGVLRAAGMDFGSVVWMHVYVTSSQDIATMNDVYWRMIGSHPPARTVLVVANLPNGEKVQISCIAAGNTVERKVIEPPGWPKGDRIDPAGIQAGEILYMSAQDGADRTTGKISEDYGTEVKQALDNVATILKTANMSMANVVWVNPYLSSAEGNAMGWPGPIGHNGQAQRPDASVMNKVYASYFEFGNTPGRGTIQVASLPNNSHIVFTAIAGSDLSKRRSIQIRNMKPSPTASPGVIYWDTYYMSGKSGFIPDQGIVTQDVSLQLRQTMRNLLDDLQGADMDFPDVVQATIYLREMQYTDQVVPLYGTFFKGSFPAQTLLQNSFDMKTATGEQISFVAVRQPTH
jgi:enamine deaminase RidA (YjgF/YER057c/UK114 family)